MKIMDNFVTLWFISTHDWILQVEARSSETLNYLLMSGNYRMLGQKIMKVRHSLSLPIETRKGQLG